MSDPGWFPDPEGRNALRYWDGGQWTEHWTELPPNAPAGPTPQAGPSASGIAPGWYPDEDNSWMERYFDGATWTEQVRAIPGMPIPIPSSTTSELPGMVIERNLGVVWATCIRQQNLMTAAHQLQRLGQLVKNGSMQLSDPRIKDNMRTGERSADAYLADQHRMKTMVRLFERVAAVGGNAVVGVRFVQSETGNEVTNEKLGTNTLGTQLRTRGVTHTAVEVVAYGTAVVARYPNAPSPSA